MTAYVLYTKRKNKSRKEPQDEAGRIKPSRLLHTRFCEICPNLGRNFLLEQRGK